MKWYLRFTPASVAIDVLVAFLASYVRGYFTNMCGYSPELALVRSCPQPFEVHVGTAIAILAAIHFIVTLVISLVGLVQNRK